MNGKNQRWLEERWNERNDERLERMYERKLKKTKAVIYGKDEKSEAKDNETV